MNDNIQDENNENVTPYKASGNLNTLISNPSVNINNTMDVNIKNVTTSSSNNNINNVNNNVNLTNYTTNNLNNNTNNTNLNNLNVRRNVSSNNDSRTYVSTDNKSKKKKISLNFGPEFKIALLIVVVLLVFIFLLPMISDLFK